VDLGRTVERAVAGSRLSTGTSELDVVVPFRQVLITGDPLQLEQALVHLLVSALHHKTEGERLQVRLVSEQQEGAPRPTAVLTLDALGSQVPAAELGRIVARFRAATDEPADAPGGSAALRMVRGEVHAQSGVVSGRSSARAMSFRAKWPTTSLKGDRPAPRS
jgi:K+-sensing histidine kinase KdpD